MSALTRAVVSRLEAYRSGDEAFEFKGTNGFMITFDIASSDVAPAAAAKKKS